MDVYKDALRLAYKAHNGQVRKFSGDPYVLHPIRVANKVKEYLAEDYWQAVALLHDVIEDCPDISSYEIEGVCNGISADIMWLTKPSDKFVNRQAKLDSYLRLLSCAPVEIRIIKMLDRIDNFCDIPVEEIKNMEYYFKEGDKLLEAISKNLPIDLIDRYFNVRRNKANAV